MLEWGSNEEAREVEQLEKLAGLETSSDDESDQPVTNADIFHSNEQLTLCDAACRSNEVNPEKCWSNLNNSLCSSGEESEDEELEEFAKMLELEVNEEHKVEEPVCSNFGCNEVED